MNTFVYVFVCLVSMIGHYNYYLIIWLSPMIYVNIIIKCPHDDHENGGETRL